MPESLRTLVSRLMSNVMAASIAIEAASIRTITKNGGVSRSAIEPGTPGRCGGDALNVFVPGIEEVLVVPLPPPPFCGEYVKLKFCRTDGGEDRPDNLPDSSAARISSVASSDTPNQT